MFDYSHQQDSFLPQQHNDDQIQITTSRKAVLADFWPLQSSVDLDDDFVVQKPS